MTVGKTTGRCDRCGEKATHVWTSRYSLKPLELCDKHTVDHRDAVSKGDWDQAS